MEGHEDSMQRQAATMETREVPCGGALRRVSVSGRGAALLETAVAVPIVLMICVGIFEFGRAYQTWQVLTNAAREGARVAVAGGMTDLEVETNVRTFMAAERLGDAGNVPITVNRKVALGSKTGTEVTIHYPFSFVLLDPAVRFVWPASTTGAPLTMSAVAIMRNES
jgi:Flp pilus assembly protein TadG